MSPASLSEEESSSSSVSIDRIDPFMSSIASLGRGDRRGSELPDIYLWCEKLGSTAVLRDLRT